MLDFVINSFSDCEDGSTTGLRQQNWIQDDVRTRIIIRILSTTKENERNRDLDTCFDIVTRENDRGEERNIKKVDGF